MERARGSAMANSLSMYSITENIYYSQLSSVAILLQPENVFTLYSTRKGLGSLSSCAVALGSSSHVSTCNGQRSSQLFCIHYTRRKFSRASQVPGMRADVSCKLQSSTGWTLKWVATSIIPLAWSDCAHPRHLTRARKLSSCKLGLTDVLTKWLRNLGYELSIADITRISGKKWYALSNLIFLCIICSNVRPFGRTLNRIYTQHASQRILLGPGQTTLKRAMK
jgi:hypothetical protein